MEILTVYYAFHIRCKSRPPSARAALAKTTGHTGLLEWRRLKIIKSLKPLLLTLVNAFLCSSYFYAYFYACRHHNGNQFVLNCPRVVNLGYHLTLNFRSSTNAHRKPICPLWTCHLSLLVQTPTDWEMTICVFLTFCQISRWRSQRRFLHSHTLSHLRVLSELHRF